MVEERTILKNIVMVEERAGRGLQSWLRRKLGENWRHVEGEGWNRASVMVKKMTGIGAESWWRRGL